MLHFPHCDFEAVKSPRQDTTRNSRHETIKGPEIKLKLRIPKLQARHPEERKETQAAKQNKPQALSQFRAAENTQALKPPMVGGGPASALLQPLNRLGL